MKERPLGDDEIEIKFVGPDGLDRLDTVELFVRDDQQREIALHYMGGPTQADINAHVWGPYRFSPGSDGATEDGRRVPGFDLTRGSTHKLQMERTRPPRWSSSPNHDFWRAQ